MSFRPNSPGPNGTKFIVQWAEDRFSGRSIATASQHQRRRERSRRSASVSTRFKWLRLSGLVVGMLLTFSITVLAQPTPTGFTQTRDGFTTGDYQTSFTDTV